MLLDVEKKSRRSAVDLFRRKLFVSSLIGYTYSSVKAGMEHIYLFRLFVMEPEKVADIGYQAMRT